MKIDEITIFRGESRRRVFVSLTELGKCYRDGVSRQHIAQVEAAESVSAVVAKRYRQALNAALARRRRLRQINERVLREMSVSSRRKNVPANSL